MRGAEDKAPGTLHFSYFKSPYLAEKLIATCGKRKCYNKNNTKNLKELELLAILPSPVLKTCLYRNNQVKRTVYSRKFPFYIWNLYLLVQTKIVIEDWVLKTF